jgi:hypothetical protein
LSSLLIEATVNIAIIIVISCGDWRCAFSFRDCSLQRAPWLRIARRAALRADARVAAEINNVKYVMRGRCRIELIPSLHLSSPYSGI